MAGTLQDNYRRQNRDGLYFGITLPTLAAIVVLTAITVEVSRPFLDMEIAMHPSPSDIPVNILLYVPLGIALGGRRLWKVLVIAGLLSVTAEFLQFFYPDRYPSLFDVVANVTGGAVGVAVARIFRRAGWIDLSEIRGNEIIGLAALFACATLILVMSKTGHFGATGQMGSAIFNPAGAGYLVLVPANRVEDAHEAAQDLIGDVWTRCRVNPTMRPPQA